MSNLGTNMTNIIFQGKNPEGKLFVLYGSMEELEQEYQTLAGAGPDDEDYGINHCEKEAHNTETRYTQEERDKELAELRAFIDGIKTDGFKSAFLKLPRKKNGSLSKGRVVTLWRGYTFQKYWEESYGFNAPVIRIKAIDDYKAELQVTSTVEGY